MPERWWKEKDRKRYSPDIRLALGSQTNDMSCFLIPEVVGVEASRSTDGLVEAVKARATSAAPGPFTISATRHSTGSPECDSKLTAYWRVSQPIVRFG